MQEGSSERRRRGEEDGLFRRKKEEGGPSFLKGKLPWHGLHARTYHCGISSGNDDKMALKINGCVSSPLSLSFVFLLLFLRLSLIYRFVHLVPALHCLIPRFLHPWLTLSRPLPLQSLIAMVTLLAIPAILTYIL